MKGFAVYFCFVASFLAAVSVSWCQKVEEIIRNDFDGSHADGSYRWALQTEGGYLEEGPQEPSLVVDGQYQYTAPDGQVVHVLYKADRDGFQPQGETLPTPPPLSTLIQRALDYVNSSVATATRIE